MDTLVLGCTHYPFASHHLQALVGPDVQLVNNGDPVARQTRRVLSSLAPLGPPGQLVLTTTGDALALTKAAQRWLGVTVNVQTLTI